MKSKERRSAEQPRFIVTEVGHTRRRRVEDGLRVTHEYRVRDTRVSPTRHDTVTVRERSEAAALKSGSGVRRRWHLFTGL